MTGGGGWVAVKNKLYCMWDTVFMTKVTITVMMVWLVLQVDCDLGGVREWLGGKMNEEMTVDAARGKLDHFIVEKFVNHQPDEEHYVW